ncbi:MAG: BlaI/MecI/CopY family transcriptional regulator [Bacteroidota bacterium]
MKELTKAELQVMHFIWDQEKCFLKDIVEAFPEPKPAYTTISTVIRVLVKKRILDYNTYGKIYEYYPRISRQDYFRKHLNSIIKMHFEGSLVSFASFLAGGEGIDLSELEEIKQVINRRIEILRGDRS